MSEIYLSKRRLFPDLIRSEAHPELGIIVVIPCYDEPDILKSLKSLHKTALPGCAVEVIIVINESAAVKEEVKFRHRESLLLIKEWIKAHDQERKRFHLLYQTDLPKKKAGVGLARKIGMDEAAARLISVGQNEGIILGFDADTICEENYFQAIEKHFQNFPQIQAASIWYEHPLEGEAYDQATYRAIIQYELHLRYFTLAKRFTSHPHAYETIGSAMAVRADAYQAQGGMNTRKAGEDFYFLNKFIILGKLNELNTTTVVPSPRVSDRVPFGTGRMVGELLDSGNGLMTYAFQSFEDLKTLISRIPEIYKTQNFDWKSLPPAIGHFLESANVSFKIKEIRDNTTSYKMFEKRFFRWFDPFLLMKYVHFARDHFYENIPVREAGKWILEKYFKKEVIDNTEKQMLLEIRECWKKGSSNS